jgi:triphosphoribosyl-dephospho-CoA synthase
MKTGRQIAQLAEIACILEVCASKPGNVNRYHDFSDTSLKDFLSSAAAIRPAFENAANDGVGRIIWNSTECTRESVGTNTNLGMILLLAPLAKAFLAAGIAEPIVAAGIIRQSLNRTLSSLTVEDARHAYAAIRLARPGGLGHVAYADVAEEPSITLLQAMDLAKDRDSIAREYITDFTITFEIGLPALEDSLSRGADFSSGVVQTFLTILSKVPDTLIARKKGHEAAERVSRKAEEVLTRGGIFTPGGRAGLVEMDGKLRDAGHTLNPGTTADLTAAVIFVALLGMPDPCVAMKGTIV